jgi:hypothetical protein
VKISDIAALPVQAGAAIRHRRLFHPTGVLANGTIEWIAATGEGLPMVPAEAAGPGLEGCRPAGRAAGHRRRGPADASATATLGRAAGVDSRRGAEPYSAAAGDVLVGATFSSLMPLGFRGGGGYAPGWPPSSTDQAFRWTPSPAKSGAAEQISTSSRPQAPAISDRWPGFRCVRLSLREAFVA